LFGLHWVGMACEARSGLKLEVDKVFPRSFSQVGMA